MKRIVALILAAAVLASVTGVASYVYLQNAEQHVLSGFSTVTVLETKGDIVAGTTFADAMGRGLIATTVVPSKFASPTMLTSTSSVNPQLVAGRDITSGRLLFDGDFVATIQNAKVLAVPTGYVAVSFTLGDPNRLAPFLSPGDRVAIFDGKGSPTAGPVMVFPDVLVLAIGNTSSTGSGNGQATPGLITVAVPVGAAPTLLRAINNGAIYLALRDPNVGAKA